MAIYLVIKIVGPSRGDEMYTVSSKMTGDPDDANRWLDDVRNEYSESNLQHLGYGQVEDNGLVTNYSGDSSGYQNHLNPTLFRERRFDPNVQYIFAQLRDVSFSDMTGDYMFIRGTLGGNRSDVAYEYIYDSGQFYITPYISMSEGAKMLPKGKDWNGIIVTQEEPDQRDAREAYLPINHISAVVRM